MKELSIKEKSKAYDKVREKIAIRFGSNVVEEIFSEFEMSEDERIRKALINGFNKLDKSAVWYNGITNGQILAWLEKQAEWNIFDFRTWQYIVSDVLTKKDGIGQYIDSGECKKIAKYMQEEWSKKLSVEQMQKELFKGEDYGIDGLYAAVDILQKTLGNVDGYQSDDGILSHKCAISAVNELSKQKSTWSEEDEKILRTIISDGIRGVEFDMLQIDWLKNLKNRFIWKPSEEQMKALGNCIGKTWFDKDTLNTLYNDLQNL